MSAFLNEFLSPSIDHVSAAVVNAGGTGHAVNDIITMSLGTGGVGTACDIRVLTVSSGVILTISIEASGIYTTRPSPTTAITQASTTGSGINFTADLTFLLEKPYIMQAKAIMDAITAGRILTVAVNSGNGGTGYVVGEIITLNDGTSIFDARFEVTSVAAGVVDGIQMVSCGAYTTLPDVTASTGSPTTASASGTGLRVDLSVEGPYTAIPTSGSEGSGFVVGEVVTVNEGTLHAGSSHHQFVVTGVSTGAITTLEPLRVGRYDVEPTNPVAITADLSGTGATIDVARNSWFHGSDTSESYFDGITDFSWICIGTNLSGGDPVIGQKCLSGGAGTCANGNQQLGLIVATGYSAAATFETQPNTSSTLNFTTQADGGTRLPAAPSGDTTIYVSISGRRICFVLEASPSFETGYQGLFTPFIDSPSTKYPFPLSCCGTTQDSAKTISDSISTGNNIETSGHCSIVHHFESNINGPFLVREPTGSWKNFEPDSSNDDAWRTWPWSGEPNNKELPPNISSGSGTVTPLRVALVMCDDDSFSSTTTQWWNQTSLSGGPAPSPFGTGGDDLYWMVPLLIYRDEPSALEIYGEFEGLFSLHGLGLNAKERVIDASGDIFTVFTDTNTAENRYFLALRETG